MTRTATLAYTGKASGAPAELQGFINFRAGLGQRELKGGEPVAVLRIGATECYHVLLLDERPSLADIDRELAKIEAGLGATTRNELEKLLRECATIT